MYSSPHVHAAHYGVTDALLLSSVHQKYVYCRILFAVELLDALANTHSDLLGTGCLADCVS